MKTYLAGPMTGYKDFNYPLFKEVTAYLRERGHDIVSPVEAVDNIEGTLPYHECLQKDLAVLLQCRQIYLLPGWKKSRGATLEVFIAACLDLSVCEIHAQDAGVFSIWSVQLPAIRAMVYLVGAWFPDWARTLKINTD